MKAAAVTPISSNNDKSSRNQQFIEACKIGDIEKVKRLLSSDIDVNAVDANKATALHWAISKNHIEVIRQLLNKNNGVDINAQDKNGMTALHLATNFGYKEIVDLLLDKNADMSIKDIKGNTAYYLAKSKGKEEIAGMLKTRHDLKEFQEGKRTAGNEIKQENIKKQDTQEEKKEPIKEEVSFIEPIVRSNDIDRPTLLASSHDNDKSKKEPYLHALTNRSGSLIGNTPSTYFSIPASLKEQLLKDNLIEKGIDYIELEKVPGDGDCGFNVLGIDRRDAVEKLLNAEHKATVEIRKSIEEDIKAFLYELFSAGSKEEQIQLAPEVFEKNKVDPSIFLTEEYKKIIEEKQKAESKVDKLVSMINDKLGLSQNNQSKDLEGLVGYLNGKEDENAKLLLEQLTEARLSILFPAEKKLLNYIRREDVYENYVKNYIGKGGFLSITRGGRGESTSGTLRALEILYNIRPFVLTVNRQNQEVELVNTPAASGRVVIMLYNGRDHFDLGVGRIKEQILDSQKFILGLETKVAESINRQLASEVDLTVTPNINHEKMLDIIKKILEEVNVLFKLGNFLECEKKIREGLKLCYNETFNKDRYIEQEYELFLRLGDLYINKTLIDDNKAIVLYKREDGKYKDLQDYPKAASIYHYAKKIIEKYPFQEKKTKQEEIEQKINVVEEKFLREVNKLPEGYNCKNVSINTNNQKKYLVKFRDYVREELKKIENLGLESKFNYDNTIGTLHKNEEQKEEKQEDQKYCLNEEGLRKRAKEIRRIYSEINSYFIGNEKSLTEGKGLLKEIISDCMQTIGKVPYDCKYCIVGLGSLALGTMTPWSDFEWAIIIDDNLNQDEISEVKEYFKQLTVLIQLRVVSFEETILPSMAIKELNDFESEEKNSDWFFDTVIPMGFSFDGSMPSACKTPIGRKGYSTHEDFELISTCKELVKFQDDEWYNKDLQLAQGITYIFRIMGDEYLVENYKSLLLNKINIIKKREINFNILSKDLERYDTLQTIDVRFGEEEKSFDIKKEIYRFIDRILPAIGSYLNIDSKNQWDLIDKLEEGNFFDIYKESADALRITLSLITELRLRIYEFSNRSHNKFITYKEEAVFGKDFENTIKEIENDIYIYKNSNLLKQIFYACINVNLQLWKTLYVDKANYNDLYVKLNLSNLNFSNIINDSYTVALVHKRFGDYNKSIKYFKDLLDNKTQSSKIILYIINYNLGHLHIILGNIDQSITYLYKAKESAETIFDERPEYYLNCIYALCDCYTIFKKNTNEAEKYINEANKYIHNFPSAKQHVFNYIYVRFANILVENGEYKKAIDIYESLVHFLTQDYTIYFNLGLAYFRNNNYSKSVENLEQSYKIALRQTGLNHHITIKIIEQLGDAYYCKGEIYNAVKQYNEIINLKHIPDRYIQYHFNALVKLSNIYNNRNLYEIKNKLLDKALTLVDMILEKERILETNLHLSVNNLPLPFEHKINYLKKNRDLKTALNIAKKFNYICKLWYSQYSYEFSLSLIHLALIYREMGKISKAYLSCKEALLNKEIIQDTKLIEKWQLIYDQLIYDFQIESYNRGVQENTKNDLKAAEYFDIAYNLAKEIAAMSNDDGTNHFAQWKEYISICKRLAVKYYNNGSLDLYIKFQKRITELLPFDRTSKHNLACGYFALAIQEKSQGLSESFNINIFNARQTFIASLKADLNEEIKSANYTEYAMFLELNHYIEDEVEYNEIVSYIIEAINSKNDGSCLSYGQLEKLTVIEPLQELLKANNEIIVKPYILAHYLLIKIHLIHKNQEEAIKAYNNFMNETKAETGYLVPYLLSYVCKELNYDHQANVFYKQYENIISKDIQKSK